MSPFPKARLLFTCSRYCTAADYLGASRIVTTSDRCRRTDRVIRTMRAYGRSLLLSDQSAYFPIELDKSTDIDPRRTSQEVV
jgi:hypothetical protein